MKPRYIQILKPIPVNKLELIEPKGIYKVFKVTPYYYLIESGATGKGCWIRKDEAVETSSEKFKLSDLAKCIKYLECMRYKLMMGHYNEKTERGVKIWQDIPIEHYFVNEFPFYSCFCAVFRKFRVKDKTGKGVHICYCPLKPYENPQWPIQKDKHLGADGKMVKTKRRSCQKYRSAKTGEVHFRSEAKRLQMVEDTPVLEIMRHLKKIKISKAMKKHLCGLWYHHIRFRVRNWEEVNKRSFT